MHSVPQRSAPPYLHGIKLLNLDQTTGQYIWPPTNIEDYATLMGDLAKQFVAPRLPGLSETRRPDEREGICAYCERACSVAPGRANSNSVDHFVPRSGRNDLCYEWTNLMYVCKKCNDDKHDGDFVDALETDSSAYVNPREPDAQDFFSFSIDDVGCRIIPNHSLDDDVKVNQAARTIRDLGLDDVHVIANRNLPLLRANYLKNLRNILVQLDLGRRRKVIQSLSNRRCEYSSLVLWGVQSGYLN